MVVAPTFSAPFRPAPYLYDGSAVTVDVPWLWDVAINGRPYLIDRQSQQYQRGFEPRIRDSVDQGNIPGENTINPQGMWRRSQDTWHRGAGQEYADNVEADPARFYTSVGVDVWTEGQLSLLPGTSEKQDTSATNMVLVSDGVRCYLGYGQTVKYLTSVDGSLTTVTGTPAANLTGMATSGNRTWIGFGASGIYRIDRSTSAASSLFTSTVDKVAYVRNRLIASSGASLYDATANAWSGTTHNLPTALFAHPNTDWVWTGFAANPGFIYASGYSGLKSAVYKITLTAEGTSLGAPSVALELPPGEKAMSLTEFPGGFVIIGTNKGVRLATQAANGDLAVGAVIPTNGDVLDAAIDDRFVWFGWTDHPSAKAGLGRLDLSQFTQVNTPAYASDVYSDTTGSVLAVERHLGRTIFGVSGGGIYIDTPSTLVASGYLDQGKWAWGVPDTKMLAKVDVRTEPIPERDSVQMVIYKDESAGETCQCQLPAGATTLTFHPTQRLVYQIRSRVTLTKSAGGVSPVVLRINLRAFVNPVRSQVMRVPIILHDRLRVDEHTEVYCDVPLELFYLRSLVKSGQIVSYQDGEESLPVLVEDVLWQPVHRFSPERRWNGTAVVTLRSVE